MSRRTGKCNAYENAEAYPEGGFDWEICFTKTGGNTLCAGNWSMLTDYLLDIPSYDNYLIFL